MDLLVFFIFTMGTNKRTKDIAKVVAREVYKNYSEGCGKYKRYCEGCGQKKKKHDAKIFLKVIARKVNKRYCQGSSSNEHHRLLF